MKKIIAAHLTLKPEKIDPFIHFTKELIEKSRAEEGNISYTLYQNPSAPTQFIFFEEWANQEAIDFHFATVHFQEFDKTIGDYIAAPPVITIYDIAAEK
jgi:quinol monooxygenase YgiN